MAERKDKEGEEKIYGEGSMIETNISISLEAFEDLVLETIEDTLTQVLGRTAANVIFFYLERNMGVRKEEFPRNIGGFCSCMAELLGPGAPVLEDLILKRLCSKLQIQYNSKLTFEGHVNRLRKRFEAKGV